MHMERSARVGDSGSLVFDDKGSAVGMVIASRTTRSRDLVHTENVTFMTSVEEVLSEVETAMRELVAVDSKVEFL